MRRFDPGKITERRQQLGMSQTKLAKHIDVSRPHVSVVEAGKAVPSAEIIARLGNILRVREDFFFVGAVSYRKRKRKKEGIDAR